MTSCRPTRYQLGVSKLQASASLDLYKPEMWELMQGLGRLPVVFTPCMTMCAPWAGPGPVLDHVVGTETIIVE